MELGKSHKESFNKIKLVLAAQQYLVSHINMSTHDKMQSLKEIAHPDSRYQYYEIRTAELLEELKNEGELKNWLPTKHDGELDKMGVDFLVVRNDGQIVPIQVTSDPRKGTRRRNKIRKTYSRYDTQRPIISVIQYLYRNNAKIDDTRMRVALANAIAITQDISPNT